MLNDPATPLSLLTTRRSAKPRELAAPGPDAAALAQILTIAMRTPDHGKLAPWRFVVIDDRDAFAQLLRTAADAAPLTPDPGKVEPFAHQAPVLVAVLSTPVADGAIPLWDQQLSAGAACMNLLHGAHAMGFVGGWLTGWAAGSPVVLAGLGGAPGDRIAGFVFIGAPGAPTSDRPRPLADERIARWPPPSAVGLDC